jgi:nucleoside-diphosphate-sugar epimerase
MLIENVSQLEEALSRPTEALLETLRRIDGDILVLGAGGKMGPTLARMARRAADRAGESRRVIAVSRFSSKAAADELKQHRVETIACDLLDRQAVAALPDAPNVIFMAGQKFGTTNSPELTWVMNTVVPAIVAERYAKSRIVVFSTGCVYPLVQVESGGSRESDPLGPPGEYANSCVGRERIFTHFSKQYGTAALLFRLSYAIDLRYGVLHDVASKVARGETVDVGMGYANVIWQGDANARALQSLARVGTPPVPLNVTGLEQVSIRELARRFGELLGCTPNIVGQENSSAWLFDAARSFELFGPVSVTLEQMIDAVAHWVKSGGTSLGKPTHFESRDGRF